MTTTAPAETTRSDDITVVATKARSHYALAVGAATVAAAILRIAIGLTDDAPSTDETAYLRSGLSLWAGDGFKRGTAPELHFPPLIPFLLGGLDRIFADPHTGTVVLTIVAGTVLVLPLAALGRRVAGPVGGITAAWLGALIPAVSTTVANRGAGSEAPYTLLVVSAVWATVVAATTTTRRVVWAAGAGALLGLAYLTRPEALLLAAPLSLAFIVAARRAPAPKRGRTAAMLLVSFAVPIGLCVVPYAAYLHGNTGRWELTAKSQDASIEAWRAVAETDREARDEVLWALDDTGLELVNTERYSLTKLARDNPSEYGGIVGVNARELLYETFVPEPDELLMWILIPVPMLALTAWGLWRYRKSATLRLVVAVAAIPLFTALAFFVQPRYLFLSSALLIVPTAAGFVALSRRNRLIAGGLGLVLLACSLVPAFYGPGGWWHPSDHTDQREAGEWIATHTDPDTRIMARSMIVEYYADRPTVVLPDGDIDEIIRFARHYGVEYLAVDWYTARRLRPQLRVLMGPEGENYTGLDLVKAIRTEGRRSRVFRLDPPPEADVPMGPGLGFTGDGG